MICAFNARGFLTDPAMKSAFGLKGKADDKTIPKQLILKKISYGSLNGALVPDQDKDKAIPHNSKCRYCERGTADAKPKAQIILDVLSSILATQMPCRSCRSGA